jgi:CO/xanthine dehydrogenase FAD-binding subunit
MKRLRSFAYFEPASIGEAVETLDAHAGAARPLAGGTDLVVDMKTGRDRPEAIVNLKRIDGLTEIIPVDGGLRIGALCRVGVLERSEAVARTHRALSMAAGVLGPPGVRALATIGGNIGRASPASDMAPPLIVHDAVASIEGVSGRREVAVEDLWRAPGMSGLAPDEIVTSVFLPCPPSRSGTAHLKIGKRGGGTDIAIVGAAAGLVLAEDGTVADARIVLASVGPTPIRAREAEELLRSIRPTGDRLDEAATAAASGIAPIDDVRGTASYRRVVARVLVARALRHALAAAEGGSP